MKEHLKGILFFSILFLIADQMIKVIISSKMVLGQTVILIKNFFSLTLTHNTGAAFSMLSGSKYLLIGIGVLALILLIIYISKLEVVDDLDVFIFSLLLGGIMGNLVDRVLHGYVIDYLSFNFGSYYFPIFNFADICIVVSIIFLIGRTIKEDLWK